MHRTFATHWLVQDLPPDAANALYAMGEEVPVERDQVLIEADAPNDAIYVILEGAFKVYLPERADRKRGATLAHRGKGDLIGEYSFIDKFSPTARIIASMPGLALRVSHAAMEEYLAEDPVVSAILYRNMLSYLVDRLRAQDEEIDSLLV
jgi:CRP-like cAMP-binding protein